MVRLRSPAPYSLGEFPSGQRGQTVNLLSLTSLVRIQLPPPNKKPSPCGSVFYLVSELGEHLRRQSRTLCRIPPQAVSGVLRGNTVKSVLQLSPATNYPHASHTQLTADPCGRYFYLVRERFKPGTRFACFSGFRIFFASALVRILCLEIDKLACQAKSMSIFACEYPASFSSSSTTAWSPFPPHPSAEG